MSEDNQWSSTKPYLGSNVMAAMTWVPEEDRARLAAYDKYDQMYWNDPRQFALRVLDEESPVYIPNARTVVNTTSHFLLKGLDIHTEDATTAKALDDFLEREMFYSRFDSAKQTGIARGDYVFHMTANPNKAAGTRI